MANGVPSTSIYRYPYWERSLGADHFYMCTDDMGASVIGSTDTHLQKNTVAMLSTPTYDQIYFVPHKVCATAENVELF